MKMLIGFLVGLAAGLLVHMTQPDAAWVEALRYYVTEPVGKIFLRLLFMLVIPLLFSALVIGIAEMGDVRSLKRVGIKTLVFTVILSSIAVLIALAAANLFQPGVGVDPAQAEAMLAAQARARRRRSSPPTGEQPAARRRPPQHHPDQHLHRRLGQRHPRGDVLRSGVRHRPAAGQHARRRNRLQDAIQGLFDVTMRLIGIVIRLAPLAIACFMFNLAAVFGWDLLARLGAYVGVVLLALGLHMFVTYPLALALLAKKSPLAFFREVQEAMVDGLLDRLVERDPADRAPGRRGQAASCRGGSRASC